MQKGDREMMLQKISRKIGYVMAIALVVTVAAVGVLLALTVITLAAKGLWWAVTN